MLEAVRRKLRKDFYPHDFDDPLEGLAAELVNEEAYRSAATAGAQAVPRDSGALADNVADVWIGHARQYVEPEEGAEAVVGRIEAKLEALRSAVNRYAEPPWGAGQQGYGEALGAADVLIDWQLGADEDHCEDCLDLADGSPYAKGDVPTWPKAGDTTCFDNCYCSIVADSDSWDAVFGGDEEK